MDLKDIKKIIEVMNENEITEFEMEKEGQKIVLKKGGKVLKSEIPIEYVAAPAAQNVASAGRMQPQAVQEPAQDMNFETIKSPMVGTFYLAPSPDSSPFVSRGQSIGPEDVVCIVEAMKVMNEIKADIKGKVIDVLVENSEPVEFGQPLFKVEKA
ncbi:acetyl-CoA carboxylase biotin carboxyl carrier protein [Candidatus Auribacterota bacterium]